MIFFTTAGATTCTIHTDTVHVGALIDVENALTTLIPRPRSRSTLEPARARRSATVVRAPSSGSFRSARGSLVPFSAAITAHMTLPSLSSARSCLSRCAVARWSSSRRCRFTSGASRGDSSMSSHSSACHSPVSSGTVPDRTCACSCCSAVGAVGAVGVGGSCGVSAGAPPGTSASTSLRASASTRPPRRSRSRTAAENISMSGGGASPNTQQ